MRNDRKTRTRTRMRNPRFAFRVLVRVSRTAERGAQNVPRSAFPLPFRVPYSSFSQFGPGGGGGGFESSVTQDARSSSMNSRTFSCAVSGVLPHSDGNEVPEPFATWKLA